MTTQPTLFGYPTTRSAQRGLYEHLGSEVFALCCAECGTNMVETASGYACCPRGHGRLLLLTDPATDIENAEAGEEN